MSSAIIPQTYEEWHHCITVIGQQELSPSYIEMRIESLNSPDDSSTQRFVQLYGEQQRVKTLQWFERAKSNAHAKS